MRIGIDARFYNPESSGLARYATELVPRLLNLPGAKMHEFVVFLPNTVEQPVTRHPHTTFVRTDIKNYTFREQTTLHTMLTAARLDITHFLHFNHPILYRGNAIFTIHDLILTFYPGLNQNVLRRFAYEVMIRSAFRKADMVIAVSHTTKREITNHYGVNARKIEVVYEAVDQRYKKCDNQRLLARVRSTYTITKPYIVYVGQLRVHKNIVRLVEAFASLHARNRSLQLVLVGKPDRYYVLEIHKAIQRHHLRKDVILTGFVPEEDLPVLYSGAVCSVTPSLMEGFGLPPLESMSCGCPVVSSNASCLPEVAGDGALYFDPYDAVDIADKLYKVVNNADLRRILVAAGQTRIKQFSWDSMAEETFHLYQRFETKK